MRLRELCNREGKRSCQVSDSNGGMVTINDFAHSQCNMFSGKTLVWQGGGQRTSSRVVSTNEVNGGK